MDMKSMQIFKSVPTFAKMAQMICREEDAKENDLNITQKIPHTED